jgi:hypothetical protein
MFSTFRTTALAAAAACLLIASVTPTRANLVTDPGFESCTSLSQNPPPGWTGAANCIDAPSRVHSGGWSARFGVSGALSQSIATTVGDTYDFSFWLSGGSSNSSFTASFGSGMVLNLSNTPLPGYTFEDFTVSATAATTMISFAAGSSASDLWFLDDVSVTLVATTPEPASLPLLAVGLVGLGMVLRRRA